MGVGGGERRRLVCRQGGAERNTTRDEFLRQRYDCRLVRKQAKLERLRWQPCPVVVVDPFPLPRLGLVCERCKQLAVPLDLDDAANLEGVREPSAIDEVEDISIEAAWPASAH